MMQSAKVPPLGVGPLRRAARVRMAWKVLVQVALWTMLVKLGLAIGGMQGAAIQYLVNG